MRSRAWLPVLIAMSALVSASGQTVAPASGAALQRLAARAGVIFAGQVLEVTRHDAAGYVDVLFRVDTAVLNCRSPGTYRLREWAGLWGSGGARYVRGQRFLMLLRAPGPSGLSAPVGGMAGRIPLVATRRPPLLQTNGTAPPESASERTEESVDLRWLNALEVRRILTAKAFGADASGCVVCGGGRGEVQQVKAEWEAASEQPSLSLVLALLEGKYGP